MANSIHREYIFDYKEFTLATDPSSMTSTQGTFTHYSIEQ